MKPTRLLIASLVLCILFLQDLSAQTQTPKNLSVQEKPTLDLTKKKEEALAKKKEPKIPKKMFYGIKTRRAFTRKVGTTKDRTVFEIFFVLKKWKDPDPYVKDLYWYNTRTKKIEIGPIPDNMKLKARLLHGPYKKKMGKSILEEGIFYVGTKHGRWEKYDRNNILLDKTKFYKGFTRDAEVVYYDLDQRYIKSMVPVQFGRKEGDYFYYTQEGWVLCQGQFKEDKPVGPWFEFHKNKKKKKEIICPKDPYDTKAKPCYCLREWDEKGRQIYDSRKDTVFKALTFPFVETK